ncbi:MAG: 1-acyl-sn-glycerol-3-phosphate acyltransferase [Desulfovibrio sp.]|nr:1-acyl-sn-glycerol-3-phosphate acyltransferase [Desulfovibrio sp.]
MNEKFHVADTYHSHVAPHGLARILPSLTFYTKLLFGPFIWLCNKARKGQCDDDCWVEGSVWFSNQLEELGCPIVVEGLDYLKNCDKPCVIVANHMSTLETFVLPGIIRPFMPCTFVVKESLVRLPLFGAVMRSRNPVVLGRKNPREDLLHILREGCQRLEQGISLIIFPQSTRMPNFDPHRFNSIGEKLAKKAQVPLIPLALKTDAWTAGSLIKEIGPIRAGMPVHFRFGAPQRVEGTGKELHEEICRFIADSLATWSTDQPVR